MGPIYRSIVGQICTLTFNNFSYRAHKAEDYTYVYIYINMDVNYI